MAPTTRRTTGKAAPRKTGAASAVSKDASLTVESETTVAVDSAVPSMEAAEAAADAEDARQAAVRDAEKAAREQATTVVPTEAPRVQTAHQEPPVVVSTEVPATQVVTEEAANAVAEASGVDPAGPPIIGSTEVPTVPGVPPVDQVVTPEVAARTQAEVDAAGGSSAVRNDLEALRALADTSGDPVTPYGGRAPAPLRPLPPLREVHVWLSDGDEGASARVVVDGFRPRVNGSYRFARRGDRITAPKDVIELGIKRGVLRREEV